MIGCTAPATAVLSSPLGTADPEVEKLPEDIEDAASKGVQRGISSTPSQPSGNAYVAVLDPTSTWKRGFRLCVCVVHSVSWTGGGN